MIYQFEYDTIFRRDDGERVQVVINPRIITERNYAGVPLTSCEDFELISIHTEQGEDITKICVTGFFFDELCNQVDNQHDKIISSKS